MKQLMEMIFLWKIRKYKDERFASTWIKFYHMGIVLKVVTKKADTMCV